MDAAQTRMPDDPRDSRYPDWLNFVFDRPETSDGWYFHSDDEFDAPPEQIARLVALTMENSGKDLARFSDTQVAHGLNYIFNNACSDVVFALMEASVPAPLRLRVILSLKILYRDCFAPRCLPVFGHLNETGNALHFPCYMFWDISPLAWWEDRPDKDIFYAAVLHVLEDTLHSPNPACVESALHGLGHLHCVLENEVSRILDRYLQHHAPGATLRCYAQKAAHGEVM